MTARFAAPPVLWRGLAGGVLAAVAGWFISTLPRGSFAMSHGPLAQWRTHDSVLGIAMAVSVVGLGLLGWAYVDLIRTPTQALRTACVWALPFLLAPPLYSEDAYIYAGEGILQRHGLSPYLHGVADLGGAFSAVANPHWATTPSPYGPVPLLVSHLLTFVTTHVLLLAMLQRVIALLGFVVLAWALRRLAARGGMSPDRATALVMASPLMLAVGVGGEHNDVLVWGLVAAAVVVALERHWLLGSVVLGVAAATKVTGVLGVLPVVLLTLPAAASLLSRIARLVAATIVSVAVLAGFGFALGFGGEWVHGLSTAFDHPSPINPLWWFLFWAPDGLFKALAVIPLVLGVVAALRLPTGRWRPVLRGYADVLLLFVLLATPLRLWYLLWAMPFAAVAPLKRRWIVPALGLAGVIAPITAIPGIAR